MFESNTDKSKQPCSTKGGIVAVGLRTHGVVLCVFVFREYSVGRAVKTDA